MGGALRGNASNGLQREYVALPPQGVTIGPLKLSNIPFFAPAGAKDISSTSDFEGLLPLRLFQRVSSPLQGALSYLKPVRNQAVRPPSMKGKITGFLLPRHLHKCGHAGTRAWLTRPG
jgi:hypothetical protein